MTKLASAVRGLFRTYAGLPRGVYVLFFANIVNSLGNFVWPLLTLLLTGKLGLPAAEAGFYVTLSTLAYVPGAFLGGKLADHLGRKPVYLVSRVMAAMALIPCAFLGTSITIAWLLILTCVLNGMSDPALTALVADLTDSRSRQKAFSLLYLGHNIGFAVGPVLAGFLYGRHLPWLFLGDALTTILSLILVAVLVRETFTRVRSRGSADTPREEWAEEGGMLAVLFRRPMLLLFALILTAFNFVYVQQGFSLPFQLNLSFGARTGPILYGTLMSINGLTVVFFTTLVTYLTSRFSAVANVALGGSLYAVGFGAYFFAGRLPAYILATFVWTLGEILVTTNSRAYVTGHTPVSHRGRVTAAIEICSGAGYALSPLFLGAYVQAFGVRPVWPLCFAVALAASGVMIRLFGAGRGVDLARTGPRGSPGASDGDITENQRNVQEIGGS